MIRVLVVGSTPPPHGGQAIMIRKLLDGAYTRVKLFHVRMAFSQGLGDMGRFRFGKILHLFRVIFSILFARLRHGTTVLYYPPAGPTRGAMYRDWAILLPTRWLFKRVVIRAASPSC
jgi:hypothetical protein